MPFKKGASGNPTGRVPNTVQVERDGETVEMTLAALARTYTVEAVEKIATIMRDPHAPRKEQREAAKLLIERGWGRPKQEIELSNPEGEAFAVSNSVSFEGLTIEELRQLEAIRGKLGGGDPPAT